MERLVGSRRWNRADNGPPFLRDLDIDLWRLPELLDAFWRIESIAGGSDSFIHYRLAASRATPYWFHLDTDDFRIDHHAVGAR